MEEGAAYPQEDFARLREALSRRFSASGEWRLFRFLRALDLLEEHLRQPLRIAVMGEQASGKSSLINLLLRENVVPTGALAGARAYLLVRYGVDPALHAVAVDGSRARLTPRALAKMSEPESSASSSMMTSGGIEAAPRKDVQAGLTAQALRPSSSGDGTTRLIEIIQPQALLQSVELVEGRACPEGAGKSLLRHVLPLDLVIWCTLATQAWKETERQSWRHLPTKLRRRAVLLVTYKDAIGAKDEAKLISRMERDAGLFFSDIVLVSLRQAAEAIGWGGAIANEVNWQASGAVGAEMVLSRHLDELERERQARASRFLHRLARLDGKNDAWSAIFSSPNSETAKHFERLISQVEAWRARADSDFSAGGSSRER